MAAERDDRLDVLLLVPSPTQDSYVLDPLLRQTYGPCGVKIRAAAADLEAFVGRDLGISGAIGTAPHKQRTLTAVTLATQLNLAELNWAAVDPGSRELGYWSERLRYYQVKRPRCVAVSTTYFVTDGWLAALIATIRRVCSQAKIIVGGYMYGTKTREFLALKADIFVTGEGEERLPCIVQAVKSGQPLKDIPGLYLRDGTGALHFTGHADPLCLENLALPDWALAKRIDPPVDPLMDNIGLAVETQRGCVFKCEFCTFRTLSSLSVMTPERAVEAIFNTATFRKGAILLADATATFPNQRWRRVLQLLIALGGSPHPIWAFARVTDLNADILRLMTRANVGALFIGQESGDQRILTAMRKGTQVTQVKPAVAALSGTGIYTTFGFIHGFPSETAETMQATRDMICRLNDGFETSPPVQQYAINPFFPQDFASASASERLRNEAVPTKLAVEETLATFIAAARVPHAPASNFLGSPTPGTNMVLPAGATPLDAFRQIKLLERGIAEFLQHDLEGRPTNGVVLRNIRDALTRNMTAPPGNLVPRFISTGRRMKAAFLRQLAREFEDDEADDIGPLTRLALWTSVLRRDTGLIETVHLLRALTGSTKDVDRKNDRALSDASLKLAAHAIEGPRNRLSKGQARRHLAGQTASGATVGALHNKGKQ
jgi:anaerobic magnesium-protoporphyrin IX monomethyl ester cyclase